MDDGAILWDRHLMTKWSMRQGLLNSVWCTYNRPGIVCKLRNRDVMGTDELERKQVGKTSWLRTWPWGTLTLEGGAEKGAQTW